MITLYNLKEILAEEYSQYLRHTCHPKRVQLRTMIKIFELRMEKYTLQEIADRFHKSRERIRQMEAKIFYFIKRRLKKEGIDGW